MPSEGVRRDLLVAGHVNVDRFLRVDRFPPRDRTVPVTSEEERLGGTAANLARVASRLGVRTGLWARIGPGFPARWRSRMAGEGIDLRGLVTVPGLPTPTCTIVEDRDGTSRTLIQQGPMARARDAPLPGRWWQTYRWLHLATGDPEHYTRLAAAARAAGLKVSVDPAQEIFYRWDRRRFRAVVGLAEILFGNRLEIAQAARWAGTDGLRGLLASVPLVVRTEGTRGATAYYRGGEDHVAAAAVPRGRSAVGAGDAFRGGFYAAWFGGEPTDVCLASGNRAARAWMVRSVGR